MLRFTIILVLLFAGYSGLSQTKTSTKKPLPKTTVTSHKPVAKTSTHSKKIAAKKPARNKSVKPVAKVSPIKKDTTQSKSLVQKPVTKETPVLKTAMREQDMMNEINYVRTRPNEYKKFILDYLQTRNPDVGTRKAATELIKTLEDMQPLLSLQFSDGLYKYAKVHGEWMEEANSFEHSEFPFAENLIGGIENVRDAVISMLIDAGDPKRGHRSNILNTKYKYIGIYEVKGEVGGLKNSFVQEMYFKDYKAQ